MQSLRVLSKSEEQITVK